MVRRAMVQDKAGTVKCECQSQATQGVFLPLRGDIPNGCAALYRAFSCWLH